MKTFTQLVGTTAATSFTLYPESFASLSQNNSASNIALGAALIDNQHRYLLEKYFDNERTFTTPTVGSMKLTLTSGPVAGATSATLTAVWTYPTNSQLVTFSDGEQLNALFTTGSAAITWATGLNNTVTTAISTVGVQFYNIPANISKSKNFTVNVGQLKYQPREIVTRTDWDNENFLPYNSDIPKCFFIYNGQVGIFPIPSTTGNIITFNYKTRVPNFSFVDYSTGNIASAGMVAGSTTVTGTTTVWTTQYPIGNVTSFNLYLRANPPNGDGLWYPIYSINSDTSLTLALPVVNAPNITGTTTYTIGQIPLLMEDFHDMLVYGALKVYFTTTVKDADKFKLFDTLYQERLSLLENYGGTKTALTVDLGAEPATVNPNLFLYAPNSNQ